MPSIAAAESTISSASTATGSVSPVWGIAPTVPVAAAAGSDAAAAAGLDVLLTVTVCWFCTGVDELSSWGVSGVGSTA